MPKRRRRGADLGARSRPSLSRHALQEHDPSPEKRSAPRIEVEALPAGSEREIGEAVPWVRPLPGRDLAPATSPQGPPIPIRVGIPEAARIGKIARQRPVQVEPDFLDELHHRVGEAHESRRADITPSPRRLPLRIARAPASGRRKACRDRSPQAPFPRAGPPHLERTCVDGVAAMGLSRRREANAGRPARIAKNGSHSGAGYEAGSLYRPAKRACGVLMGFRSVSSACQLGKYTLFNA